ncbi:MAG TPA: hypothetical protein VE974_17955 [Thermoanaerobaculia bacterium]|nr:hypothetical protein [Thermoanaerobaculia bacterium]
MRRWRVVVIDDNPEGSLEAVLLSPLVVSRQLPIDATSEQMRSALAHNLLNEYLPLAAGETYATYADIEFQILDFQSRRAECAPRKPMVEVERDFGRAWRLVDDLAADPPDIIFLDVMFDLKTTPAREIEAIIDQLQRTDRISISGRASAREVLSRGGLFLLGKLLRSRGQMQQMPLTVLYSASREVHSDFRPFEYASDGRFEVIEKSVLRNNAERRKQVFRRRIRDYFLDGTVRPEEARAAVELLASPAAIHGDRDVLVSAFSREIGSNWCFGTMFVGESVAYLASEPARRHAVVADLESFMSPLVADARSFVDLYTSSPARLFTHNGPILYARHPSWLDPHIGVLTAKGHVQVACEDLNGQMTDVRAALESAVKRLPEGLRNALSRSLEGHRAGSRKGAALDAVVRSLEAYNKEWQALLDRCRMRMPAYDLTAFFAEQAGDLKLDVSSIDAIRTGAWDLDAKLELLLSPSESMVKEPLGSLLTAILQGIRGHAYRGCDPASGVNVEFSRYDSPSTLRISIRDHGAGFPDLRYYDPHGRSGDFSTALLAAAEWFEVEVHSGGIRRRPTLRSSEIESSPVTSGTQFDIRIPAYRLEA